MKDASQNPEINKLEINLVNIKNAYVKLTKWYLLLLDEEDSFLNEIEQLKSNIEGLESWINHQLFLSFEIMQAVVRETTLDYDFSRLE